jgi:hypothetical protein
LACFAVWGDEGMETKDTLLQLVRHAFDLEPYLAEEPFVGVFSLARDNGLSGLLYESIDSQWTTKEELALFQKDYFQYLKRDTLQMEAVKQLHRLFHEQAIDHMFLKGTRLKELYPQTYWRSMGDIDVLIRPEKMKQAHDIMDSLGYDNTSNSANHDMFVKDRDVVVEVHPKLTNESTEKHNALFDDVWGVVKETKEHEFEFPVEVELVYLLIHLAKHFASSGVGLRSVLDIGVFLWKKSDQLNLDVLHRLLEETKLTLFYENMVLLNHRWFAFPILRYAKVEELDPRFADALLAYLIESGVHGKGRDFNSYLAGMAARTAQSGSVSQGRLKFFLKMAFPSCEEMTSTYPYLNKHRWLLPVAWFQRFWTLLFKKTKRTFRNIKRLRVDKTAIQEASELYQKLGL